MFSYQLVQELKKAKGLRTDLEASTLIAGLNSGNMSQIKSGKRHLTEEQALFIAHECNLNPEWVLVSLAEEVSRSDEAKEVWHQFAKKLNKSVLAAILAVTVVFGGLDANSEKGAVFV
ncbi:phage gp37-like protein [Rheinheimera pacifica]|uniref:DUF3693 domain-containing protein n=1 Tax=Rheinheimera pacifica TaxID=173990 RepID=UPI00286509D8|nr:DUF3693 domain-containing protein [Rheinheimera pacifica]MDR6982884.1 phage gp37-like protein [Rheinheimera pacifica]